MILVTGGLGFIGVSLGRYLAEIGETCVLTRRHTSDVPSFLEPYVGKQVQIAQCDLSQRADVERVIKEYGVTSIIHAAFQSRHAGTPADLHALVAANTIGTLNIFTLAAEHGLLVTTCSSVTVFYGLAGPWTDEMPLPLSDYNPIAASKRGEENIAHLYAKDVGLNVRVVRPPYVYGPHYSSGRNPVYAMINAGAEGRNIELSHINPAAGGDFLHVRDTAIGIAKVHVPKSLPHHTYNLGANRFISYGEIAQVIAKETGITITLGEEIPFSRNHYMSSDRIAQDVGFRMSIDIEKGTRNWLKYVKTGQYEV